MSLALERRTLREPPTPFGTTAGTWRVDSSASVARFSARSFWGALPVEGELGDMTGALSWDGATGRGYTAVATAALDTGNRLRDHHLRSHDFFAVADHPEVRFDVMEARAVGDTVELRGVLMVRGERYAFATEATASRLGAGRVALEARAAFDLEELGMSRGLLGMIRPDVRAEVRVVLDRVPSVRAATAA